MLLRELTGAYRSYGSYGCTRRIFQFLADEINNEIHDKELLAIIDIFKYWHQFCKGPVEDSLINVLL